MQITLGNSNILTKKLSESVRFIHDRMPVILPQDIINDWISPETNPTTMHKYALDDMITEKVIEEKGQMPNQMTFDIYEEWNDLIDEHGWIDIEDPLPDCQHDAFSLHFN